MGQIGSHWIVFHEIWLKKFAKNDYWLSHVFLSVRPRWDNSAPIGWFFMKFDIWAFFFRKICRENSSFTKIWQEQRVVYVNMFVHLWLYLVQFFLEWETFRDKIIEKIKTHILFNLILVVPCIMLYSGEISPTRCNNYVFILRNGFTLHVSGDNITHHQEYICCIWPQVSRLT